MRADNLSTLKDVYVCDDEWQIRQPLFLCVFVLIRSAQLERGEACPKATDQPPASHRHTGLPCDGNSGSRGHAAGLPCERTPNNYAHKAPSPAATAESRTSHCPVLCRPQHARVPHSDTRTDIRTHRHHLPLYMMCPHPRFLSRSPLAHNPTRFHAVHNTCTACRNALRVVMCACAGSLFFVNGYRPRSMPGTWWAVTRRTMVNGQPTLSHTHAHHIEVADT
jgi:hypothetical protein